MVVEVGLALGQVVRSIFCFEDGVGVTGNGDAEIQEGGQLSWEDDAPVVRLVVPRGELNLGLENKDLKFCECKKRWMAINLILISLQSPCMEKCR